MALLVSAVDFCFFSLLMLLSGTRKGETARFLVSMPAELEAAVGETAVITCVPSISEAFNITYVQWFSSDRGSRQRIYYMDQNENSTDKNTGYTNRISVSDDFTLTISPVTLQDERSFLCQIGAGPAGNGENKTELRIYKSPSLPVVHVSDKGISVNDERPEIATCVTKNGYPTPNITWYKDRTPMKDNDETRISASVVKESSGLYTVSSTLYHRVTKEDRIEKFYCEVSYRMPGADKMMESERVNLTLHYPTEEVNVMVVSPTDEIREGDNVTIKCKGDGNPEPEVSFFKIKEGEDDEEMESNEDTLILSDVKRTDSGRYECRTFDLLYSTEVSAAITLVVNHLSEVMLTPEKPTDVMLGGNLTIYCNALGSQKTSVIWKKKNHVVAKTNALTLTDVTYQSAGDYTCEVTMPSVPRLSRKKATRVIVKGAPEFELKADELWVHEGEIVNVTCKAMGYPRPEITWSINGTMTQKNVNHHTSAGHLSLQVTQELAAAGVSCTASNSLGSVNKKISFQLHVVTIPPTSAPVSAKAPLQKESKGIIIVVVIVCILVFAILGAVLYFLYKKGKIPCGRSGKKDMVKNTST
ncbi:cell surface glycoprotein MUC18 isoform X2 [Protopterus annectens]|uniref:cell surface glycoprotein MUC18 isoform X2 n=1 Tax=Protopterus annectens TaxID=7888 RepID=UPI001CFA6B9D|nr:cell surface glycoprotein MUC18 isoform X2 [Protopterus annectens]